MYQGFQLIKHRKTRSSHVVTHYFCMTKRIRKRLSRCSTFFTNAIKFCLFSLNDFRDQRNLMHERTQHSIKANSSSGLLIVSIFHLWGGAFLTPQNTVNKVRKIRMIKFIWNTLIKQTKNIYFRILWIIFSILNLVLSFTNSSLLLFKILYILSVSDFSFFQSTVFKK